MYMTEEEICTSYRDARDQFKQIKILSELNVCDKEQIIDILEKHGYDTSKPKFYQNIDYMTISYVHKKYLMCLPLDVQKRCKGQNISFVKKEFEKFVKKMYKTNTIEEIVNYTGMEEDYIRKIVKAK